MTTNETSFFRDGHPFETLRTRVLPELIERRRTTRTLAIWSAACSYGQEPYSLAMLLLDAFPELSSWQVGILATDLSRTALDKAKHGLYSPLEVGRGLPVHLLANHFERHGSGFRASKRLRDLVTWRELNLAATWPLMPRFDLVLMRNVLIYFRPATAQTVLRRVRDALNIDGYLLLGTTENLIGADVGLEPLVAGRTTLYRRVGISRRP